MTTAKSKKNLRSVPQKAHFKSTKRTVIKSARKILYEQSTAIANLAFKINGEYFQALDILYNTKGHVVVSGIGKSGLIGRNMAATFASTGTPSIFVHPAEARHGDLGMIRENDSTILISYSGETEDVIQLIPYMKRSGVPIIAFVGDINSTLAKNADVIIDISVEREVCPNNLAPTSSTITTLAMANSFAVSLIKERNFKPQEFAEFHPGGNLGKLLNSRVKDVMRKDSLPTAQKDQTVQESLFTMSAGRLGLVLIMDGDNMNGSNLKGIVTDGDLRRALQKHDDTLNIPISRIMSKKPVTVMEDTMLFDAEKLMKKKQITALVVMSPKKQISGILSILDNNFFHQ